MLEIIILIATLIGGAYMCYHGYVAIAGNLKPLKPIAYATPNCRFAVVIPARNEARVVPQAVDSLLKQNYPRALFDVYVVPNNCTDDTAGAARDAGARVMTCEEEVHSKGEVLHHTFRKLLNGPEQYDAFIILDADNIVDGGFLQASNNAYEAGYQVGQSYRDSKNPDDNWISGCTSLFFWFMNRLFNHPRASLGLSASLNGTGIMMSAQFLRKNGYDTTTLTEDLEMSAQCALAGERIAWMPDAITYDEQPRSLKDSFTQRRRWAAGTKQCAKKYLKALFRDGRHNRLSFDVGMHFLGVYAMVLGTVPAVLTVASLVQKIVADPASGLIDSAIALLAAIAGCLLLSMAMTYVVCGLEGKLSKKRWREALTMGWFFVTWAPANLLGYLWRPPTWVEIPHTVEMAIDEQGEVKRGTRKQKQQKHKAAKAAKAKQRYEEI